MPQDVSQCGQIAPLAQEARGLFVQVTPAGLDTALAALQEEGMLDAQDRPQMEQLSNLVDEC